MPRPSLRLVVVAAALAATVTACGGKGGSDNGALAGPIPSGQAVSGSPYRHLPVTQASVGDVRYPIITGTAAAAKLNAALLAKARTLTGEKVACAVSTLRADTRLVSFQWTCAGKGGTTATYRTATAQALTLADLFRPGYLDQLSSTAVTQLELGGATPAAARAAAPPTLAAFGQWAVDESSLLVAFTVASKPVTVSFPLASLASIALPGGPLGTS